MLPLYVGGLPGGSDLFVRYAVHLGFALPVAVYAYYDASRRESRHSLAWALAPLAIGGGNALIIGALYLVVRDEVGVGHRTD